MIHIIWILSVLYRIPTYLIVSEHYYHYNKYAIILFSLHRTAGPSRCLIFVIHNTFVVCKTGKTVTIHGCCFIISHTPPAIRSNVASLWSTKTNISALYWYSYYWGLVYRINIIFRTIQGDCFLWSYSWWKYLCDIVQF